MPLIKCVTQSCFGSVPQVKKLYGYPSCKRVTNFSINMFSGKLSYTQHTQLVSVAKQADLGLALL